MTGFAAKAGNKHFPNARARLLAIRDQELATQHLTTRCSRCERSFTGGFFDARDWFKTHECEDTSL